jgi:hypothetical protein
MFCHLPSQVAGSGVGGFRALPWRSLGWLFAAGNGLGAEFLREPLNATFGVDELLTPGKERVAVRADFQVQFLLGRPRLPGRSAGTPGLYVMIFGMNAFFHDKAPLAKP